MLADMGGGGMTMKKGAKKVKKVIDSFVDKSVVCDHAWLPWLWERDGRGVAVAKVRKCGVCGESERVAA
jgi:hypothetical protein